MKAKCFCNSAICFRVYVWKVALHRRDQQLTSLFHRFGVLLIWALEFEQRKKKDERMFHLNNWKLGIDLQLMRHKCVVYAKSFFGEGEIAYPSDNKNSNLLILRLFLLPTLTMWRKMVCKKIKIYGRRKKEKSVIGKSFFLPVAMMIWYEDSPLARSSVCRIKMGSFDTHCIHKEIQSESKHFPFYYSILVLFSHCLGCL